MTIVSTIGLLRKEIDHVHRKLIENDVYCELRYAGDIGMGANMQKFALARAAGADFVAINPRFARYIPAALLVDSACVIRFRGKSDLVRQLVERLGPASSGPRNAA